MIPVTGDIVIVIHRTDTMV